MRGYDIFEEICKKEAEGIFQTLFTAISISILSDILVYRVILQTSESGPCLHIHV